MTNQRILSLEFSLIIVTAMMCCFIYLFFATASELIKTQEELTYYKIHSTLNTTKEIKIIQ